MNTAMIIIAVLCLVSSFLVFPGIREQTLDQVVKAILGNTEYIQMVMGR